MNKLTTDHTFFAKAAGQWQFPVTTSNENGKLLFKADIAAETSDVYYLEGIYVAQTQWAEVRLRLSTGKAFSSATAFW